jgi:hypothetical protein
MPAGARIDRSVRAVGCGAGAGYLFHDVLARAEAGIDDSQGVEPGECCPIVRHVRRLVADGPVPSEAEPGEILQNRLGEGGPAARVVDVLDAHQEAAAGAARLPPGEDGRIGRAQMQLAGGARREAGDDGRRHPGRLSPLLI